MKTAISIPDTIFQAAEKLAKKLGVSRSELYVTAIKLFIKSHSGDDITRSLNKLYDEETSSLDPVIATLQQASIDPRDEW